MNDKLTFNYLRNKGFIIYISEDVNMAARHFLFRKHDVSHKPVIYKTNNRYFLDSLNTTDRVYFCPMCGRELEKETRQ